MTSILMEADESSSFVSDNARIAGLESQILNSQEVIVRLNCELDSALLRITTLETVCSQTQNDLHEKRLRIKQLDDDMTEREEINERLIQELEEKNERLKNLDDLIIQLKQHIKQAKQENEDEDERQIDNADIKCQQCQFLLEKFGDTLSITDLHSQIMFDRELRQLILQDLDDVEKNSSPQTIIEQYHENERLKFHNLLEKSLTTEDISNLIDSDDILFESLTHLNSLIRLKETLSHDSQQFQHIRSLLHLTNENNDELIQDFITKRDCIEYIRTKIVNHQDLNDFDLIKYVLHDYFNFQQQQIELKEYLHIDNDDLNYSRILIERCSEAMHVGVELNEALEQRKEIDEIVSKFYNQPIDQHNSEVTQLDRIRSMLQSNIDFQHALFAETSVTSTEDVLQRLREYKLNYETHQTSTEEHLDQDQQVIIDELTREINELKEEASHRKNQLKEITNSLESENDDEEVQFNLIRSFLQSCTSFRLSLSNKLSVIDNNESILQRIDDYQSIINQLNSQENNWTNETTDKLVMKLKTMENAGNTVEDLQKQLNEAIHNEKQLQIDIEEIADEFAPKANDHQESNLIRIRHLLQSLTNFRQEIFEKTQMNTQEDILQLFPKYQEKQDVESQTTDDDEFYLQIKELIGAEEDNPEEIINKIKELSQLPSQTQINELKEEASHRKNQLKELTNFLEPDNEDEEVQFNLIRSFLQSCTSFRLSLSNKLSVIDNNESILQRVDDYQSIINQLNSQENNWTNETTDKLLIKLKTMENAGNTVEDLQKQLNEASHNEKQLQIDIEEIADEFAPKANDHQESNLIRIRHLLQSLTNFRQEIFEKTQMNTEEDILQLFPKYQEKQDVESQTTDDDEFYLQIKELIGVEEDNAEEIIDKIKELSQLPSQSKINELFSNNEKLRHVLNLEDENLVESVMDLHKNFLQLKEKHDILVKKEDNIDKSIERLVTKFGLSSDSSPRTQVDELCAIFDRFCLEYCQLISPDMEMMNLIEIFQHIQLVVGVNNRLKELINQIDFDKSTDNGDYISNLQIYTTKVDALCQLICNDKANIDQALVIYQEKTEHDKNAIEKMSDFKQRLLTRLSIDNEEQIFDRLHEIQQMNTDLKEKLQSNDDFTNTISSLNITITEQRKKILEHEETLEKIRAQRERMLNKMKEMKSNNETLANQLTQVNQSLDEFHRKEIDYKNHIEELEQQLRSANNQIQVTLDECQTQQDLQETMKLEIESIQNENETQKKLYESRFRQIINEKNHLDKTKKELIEQKQILEDDNKRLQTILHTIKDTLENVDDINSIVDTILKLRQDHMKLTSELNQRNEQMHVENEKLVGNVHRQQSIINEYIRTKTELERRLLDNEQELRNLKKEIEDKNDQYQRLQNEYQLYKEDNQTRKNSQVAIIDIEQSLPSSPQPYIVPVQQAAESNNWMAIDMKDEEIIPLATVNKHSTIDTTTALFNLLGELKSKLGITLTHRPRSSSVFFLYLCAVHLLTLYLLFIRHC